MQKDDQQSELSDPFPEYLGVQIERILLVGFQHSAMICYISSVQPAFDLEALCGCKERTVTCEMVRFNKRFHSFNWPKNLNVKIRHTWAICSGDRDNHGWNHICSPSCWVIQIGNRSVSHEKCTLLCATFQSVTAIERNFQVIRIFSTGACLFLLERKVVQLELPKTNFRKAEFFEEATVVQSLLESFGMNQQ